MGRQKKDGMSIAGSSSTLLGFDHPCSSAQDPAEIPPTPETSSDALTDQCDHRWAVRSWWQQLLSYDLATLLCVQLSSLPKIILSSTDYKMQWQPAGRWESFRMRSNQCKHTQYKRSGSSMVAQTFGSLASGPMVNVIWWTSARKTS